MKVKGMKVVVAVSVVSSVFFAGCGKSIEPASYCNVKYKGVNGSATAEIEFDESFYMDLYNELSDKKEKELLTECGGSSDFAMLGLAYAIELNGDFDKDTGLSNGDVITLHLTWNEENAKKYGLKLNGDKDVKFTVDGLQG